MSAYKQLPVVPEQIKADFPILQRQVHDKPLVYLDSAATSQKPRQVIQAISNYYEQHNANVHRGLHQLGDESTQIFHDSRRIIADFLGATAEELIVVRNETEAANQVAYSWGEQQIHAGDVILVTEMDHHSNIVPWQELAQRQGAHLEFIAVTEQGELNVVDMEKKLQSGGAGDKKTQVKLVAFSHVSNSLGTLNPVKDLVKLIRHHQPQAAIFIDGAQAAPHIPVDFHDLDVDFYAVSAHKMLGPMGMGGLLVKKKWLATLPPFLTGGGMIVEVTTQGTTFAEDLEERFTAGTPDVAGLAGWAAACNYLDVWGMEQLARHDQELVTYTLEQLEAFPQIQVVGPLDPAKRVGSVTFLYEGVHAHDVSQVLDSEGVAVRSGHHCTMPLHHKYGWPATTRASFQLYTSTADIDVMIKALHKVKTIFGK